MNYERTDSAPARMRNHSSRVDYLMSTQAHGDALAVEQVKGGDAGLTAQTFGEFVAGATERRSPLMTHTHTIVGPISDAELLALMLHTDHGDCMLAAACRELTARYLADINTQTVVDSVSEQIGAAA